MKERETQRKPASAAVVALREALGMTQQRFAVEVLRSALNTVARYETTNPPRGEALLRLAAIAEEAARKLPPEAAESADTPQRREAIKRRTMLLYGIADQFRYLHLGETLGDQTRLVRWGDQGWFVAKLKSREQIDDVIDLLRKWRGHTPEFQKAFEDGLLGYQGKGKRKSSKQR